MKKRGAFIVFEGIDRCGKSTQTRALMEWLRMKGIEASSVHFPSRDTPIGKLLSRYLSGQRDIGCHSAECMHLLFSANRWEKMAEIEKLLSDGVCVISDRYAFSGVAYSVAHTSLQYEWCRAADKGILSPDLVFLIDVEPKLAAQRSGYGTEILETVAIQEKVKEAFKNFESEAFWCIVDGRLSIEEMSIVIRKKVEDLLRNSQLNSTKGLWTDSWSPSTAPLEN